VRGSGSAKTGSRIATYILGFGTFYSLSDVYKLRQKLEKKNSRKHLLMTEDRCPVKFAWLFIDMNFTWRARQLMSDTVCF
jgi:hypothetical protein